ncbi:MAG: TRAP transporter large permease [Chloroflexi bacterium]|nr:TRAP transporter large permease [Chloroflexota bacterium]
MDLFLVGLLSFVVLLVLIMSGLHVGTALLIVAMLGLIMARGTETAFNTLDYIPYNSISDYNWAVFPLFVLMGELASASGVVSTLFETAEAWVGRWKGGMGMVVTAMAAALGAITGSALAALAMLTRVVFPQMLRMGYDAATSAGLLASVSPLAVLIPPSIVLSFYGVITRESIGRLLIAGFIPGFLSAVVYMTLVYIMALRHPERWPVTPHTFTWRHKLSASRGIAPILVMMLVILVGIYMGVFTPSEAGAAGSIVALVLVVIYKRKKSPQAAFSAVWESAGMTAMIFYIMIGAVLYGRFMSSTGAADRIIQAIAGIQVSPYVTFAMLVILFLILGCFVDDFSMMAITLPVAHPLMKLLGFDPIWFGVIVVILVEAALITPPFGLAVFAIKGLIGSKAELWPIFRAASPFLIAMIVMIVVLTIWPEIALFLPNKMG